MYFEEYHQAFDRFRDELIRRLNVSDKTWSRRSEEMFDHKRTREFGVWCIQGGQMHGYIFSASCFTWDGYVNWQRIIEICENTSLAIKDDEPSRIWDLAKIETQKEPLPRCQKCGLVFEE